VNDTSCHEALRNGAKAVGSAPLDSDGDGMPDEWEQKYGFSPSDASNASKDKDGDGYTNIEEYLNGTDPTEFVDYTKPENNVNTLSATVFKTN